MSKTYKLVFFIISIYCLSYLLCFWQTPLGQTPVLDGSENILLAKQIATNNLPKEPFFRSMLYPALLSIFYSVGLKSTDELFWIASFSGMIFHLLNALLVFLLVKNLSKSEKFSIIAALIYGLYPPAIFFAAEPLDTTISICFMLLALYLFFLAIDDNKKLYFSLSGIMMGISGLLRSNLLPFAIIYIAYPIVKILMSTRKNIDVYEKNNDDLKNIAIIKINRVYKIFFTNVKKSLHSVAALLMIIGFGGLACYINSGEFKILPWQGGANIYTANSLNANGKYYKHSIYLETRKNGYNPARLESEVIYVKETGKKPPFDLNEFNKFWIKKTIYEIKSNPKRWIILMLKKIYYLCNNYEQYNNKTFGFHKEKSPILRYNPLCYGFLFVLYVIGGGLTVINALKDSRQNMKEKTEFEEESKKINVERSEIINRIITVHCGIISLGIGIIAFYVSSRFRLPLVSLMLISSSIILSISYRYLFVVIGATIISGLLTFSTFFNVADKSTYKEDKLLNAFACSRLDLLDEQLYWANQVLTDDSTNLQAIRLKIVAFTNLVLSGKINDEKDWNEVRKEMEYVINKDINFDDILLLKGCYVWKFKKEKEMAKNIWFGALKTTSQPELYEACLIYVGFIEPNKSELDKMIHTPLLLAALESRGVNTGLANEPEVIEAKQSLKFLLDN